MKKYSSLLALLLIVAMVFTFSACGGSSDKKAIVGTWSAKVDMTDAFVSGLVEGLGDAAEVLDRPAKEYFSGVAIPMNLTLNEDGSFVLAPTEGWKDEVVNSLAPSMETFLGDFMVAYLSSYLLEMGVTVDISTPEALDKFLQDSVGMNLNEMIEQTLGMDFMSFIRQALDEEDIDAESTTTGYYEIVQKEGKILFAAEKGGLNKAAFDLYELNGDTLTLRAGSGSELILFADDDLTDLTNLVTLSRAA